MGAPARQLGRKALHGLLPRLDDGKTYVKAEAEETLNAWVSVCGLQTSGSSLDKALQRGMGRREILLAIHAAVAAGPLPHESTMPGAGVAMVASGLVAAMTDKVSEVRLLAEQLLVLAVAGGARKTLRSSIDSYSKAIQVCHFYNLLNPLGLVPLISLTPWLFLL